MTSTETSLSPIINIEALSFENGAHLLIKKSLRDLPAGARLGVCAASDNEREFLTHLRGWCRTNGHEFFLPEAENVSAWIGRGASVNGRWKGAERSEINSPLDAPSLRWGFAARGAMVESGGENFHYALYEKEQVWAENAPKLYAQAVAAQWNPNTAINWNEPFELDDDVESAVVQVMT